MIRVVVVDDEELVRDGLVAIVEADSGLEVIGSAADGQEAVAMTLRLRPDVVLMDVRMPVLDGVEATRRIVRSAPEVRVLVLTTVESDEVVSAALRAGAAGFLLKSARRDRLHAAIRAVADGETLLAPSIVRRLVEDHLATGPARRVTMHLTARQADVTRLVAAGLTNAEIAARLHLSAATVKGYVSDILGEHGLRDRAQLVVLAYESGVVTPGRAAGGAGGPAPG